MRDELKCAVWAAAYVEVLSARGGDYSIKSDHNITSVAEALGDPTGERVKLAIAAADKAVRRLDKELIAVGRE
jgi:hypothetical protein